MKLALAKSIPLSFDRMMDLSMDTVTWDKVSSFAMMSSAICILGFPLRDFSTSSRSDAQPSEGQFLEIVMHEQHGLLIEEVAKDPKVMTNVEQFASDDHQDSL